MEDAAEGSDRAVVVEDGAWRMEVHLRETVAGSGSWSVTEVGIRSTEPHRAITSSALSRLPYRRMLARAVDDARGATPEASTFAFPSDPPPAFQEGRRGRAARSPADWAGFAAAWLAGVQVLNGDQLDLDRTRDRERALPQEWADRFPEVKLKTWRNLVSQMRTRGMIEARRFPGGQQHYGLSDEAERLLLGDPDSRMPDGDLDAALDLAFMQPGDPTWKHGVRRGVNPAARRAEARRVLGLADPEPEPTSTTDTTA